MKVQFSITPFFDVKYTAPLFLAVELMNFELAIVIFSLFALIEPPLEVEVQFSKIQLSTKALGQLISKAPPLPLVFMLVKLQSLIVNGPLYSLNLLLAPFEKLHFSIVVFSE